MHLLGAGPQHGITVVNGQLHLIQDTLNFSEGLVQQVMGAAAGLEAAVDEEAIHRRL